MLRDVCFSQIVVVCGLVLSLLVEDSLYFILLRRVHNATKKEIKSSASSSNFFDNSKFVREEAENRYHDMVVNKNCIPKWGFDDLEPYM